MWNQRLVWPGCDCRTSTMSSVMETSPALPAPCPGEAREPRPVAPAMPAGCRLYLSTTLCSILLAFLLLMVGVSITSMMFRNAKTTENKVFPIGPLLLIAGLLSIGRVLLQRRQATEQRLRLERQRRRLSAHVVRTGHSPEVVVVIHDDCLARYIVMIVMICC